MSKMYLQIIYIKRFLWSSLLLEKSAFESTKETLELDPLLRLESETNINDFCFFRPILLPLSKQTSVSKE